jgi:hypothetical protein
LTISRGSPAYRASKSRRASACLASGNVAG